MKLKHNPSLPEMAMKERHPKVLKVKPLRGSHALSEAFWFGQHRT
jgi:hypothetical protein